MNPTALGLWVLDPTLDVTIINTSGWPEGNPWTLGSAAKSWAMAHIHRAGGGWRNAATGWDIAVTGKGINEAITRLKWPKAEAIMTVSSIPELIRTAIPIQTEPDKAGRREILHVHTLIGAIRLHTGIYRACLTIRETNMGRKYYGHHLEGLDIEKPGADSVCLREGLPPTGTRHPGTLKVGLLLDGFKPHFREPADRGWG